jgi:hypothetical protein
MASDPFCPCNLIQRTNRGITTGAVTRLQVPTLQSLRIVLLRSMLRASSEINSSQLLTFGFSKDEGL